jgi:hypothetical protein
MATTTILNFFQPPKAATHYGGIFTGSKTCCTIWRPFWFAMAVMLNPKWSPKYKNPPNWAKFGFQIDYDVAN